MLMPQSALGLAPRTGKEDEGDKEGQTVEDDDGRLPRSRRAGEEIEGPLEQKRDEKAGASPPVPGAGDHQGDHQGGDVEADGSVMRKQVGEQQDQREGEQRQTVTQKKWAKVLLHR